jgi:hypothetical protein
MIERKNNSLISSWGDDKQENWSFLKSITAREAFNYYVKDKPSFIDFFKLIAERRKKIGFLLNHRDCTEFGTLRDPC